MVKMVNRVGDWVDVHFSVLLFIFAIICLGTVGWVQYRTGRIYSKLDDHITLEEPILMSVEEMKKALEKSPIERYGPSGGVSANDLRDVGIKLDEIKVKMDALEVRIDKLAEQHK